MLDIHAPVDMRLDSIPAWAQPGSKFGGHWAQPGPILSSWLLRLARYIPVQPAAVQPPAMMSSSAASSGGLAMKPADKALLGPLIIREMKRDLKGATARARQAKALLDAVRNSRDRRERMHTDYDYAYEDDDDDSSDDIAADLTGEQLDEDIAADVEGAEEACQHEALLRARLTAAMKISYKLRRTTRAAPPYSCFDGFLGSACGALPRWGGSAATGHQADQSSDKLVALGPDG